MSLALHQFPEPIRMQVLEQAHHVAKHLIIADYAAPLPVSPAGWLTASIEKLAGKEHYDAFRSYQASGGIPGICQQLGLQPNQTIITGNGVFSVTRI